MYSFIPEKTLRLVYKPFYLAKYNLIRDFYKIINYEGYGYTVRLNAFSRAARLQIIHVGLPWGQYEG